jgi:uncharacterized protein YlxW (UPF0749 family)
MSDTYNGMYEDDGEEYDVGYTTQQPPAIALHEHGMVTEIEVNGKKISIVESTLVLRLENTVKLLQATVAKLENDLRSLRNRINSNERHIQSINRELDNKVSYE